MSDIHARFDELVATLERKFGISLDHVKDAAAPVDAPVAEPAPVDVPATPAA